MVKKIYAGLGIEQLGDEEKSLRRALLEINFARAAGKQFDTASKGKSRKELARVLTAARMKRVG